MMVVTTDDVWEEALAAERPALVRLCTRFTRDREAAEDLAQETLLQAWRHRRQLRDPARRRQWLAAIARRLGLQWLQGHARALERTTSVQGHGEQGMPGREDEPPDPFDVELILERDDLARLLDRALALLPPPTRLVLLERYINELPEAQIALRLGLSTGAVAMRLQRGKLAMHQLLTTTFRQEAAAYGLDGAADTWQHTRIWCAHCGERRLWGRFGPDGELEIECRGCQGRRAYCMVDGRFASLLAGVKGYKPAYNRVLDAGHAEFGRGIAGRRPRCPYCGEPAPYRVSPTDSSGYRDLERLCPRCGPVAGPTSVGGIVTATPQGRRFWREHGRVRSLPQREVEAGGGPALVATLESVASHARLEVLFGRDTLDVIAIHGEAGS